MLSKRERVMNHQMKEETDQTDIEFKLKTEKETHNETRSKDKS